MPFIIGVVSGAAGEGSTVLSCDEMHARPRSDAGYGRRPTNGHDTVKTIYYGKSVSVFGVPGSDSLHVRTVNAYNSATLKWFLRMIMRIHTRILLILDNASPTSRTPSPALPKATGAGSGWSSCPPTPSRSTR